MVVGPRSTRKGVVWRSSTRGSARLAALAALITSVVLTACGNSASPSSKHAVVPLVVYSAQGYDANTVKAFQQATGIPTKLVDDSTGPLLARIQAERNNPQWGLLWVDGDMAFAALDKEGMLLRGFEPNVDWTAAGRSVTPSDRSYVPTGLTIAAAVVYNRAKVSSPPGSWIDLLDPQYRGILGMNNPAISGPTYPYVAGLLAQMGGVSQGERFLSQLKAAGLQINPTNGDTLHALAAGQIQMATIQSSAIVGAMSKNPSLAIAFPYPVTLLPGCIGIDSRAPAAEQAEAKRFAEFVLSSAGQQQMQTGDPTGDSLFWPVVNGVQPLAGLPPLSSVPYQHIDPYVWGPREAAVNQWFVNAVAG